ncbi:MAG: pyridoxal phosphate-dependent aminotransferase [Lachnospiraceae bacterium]
MVSEKLFQLGNQRSAIRELFEYGKSRAAIIGADNVFDFSIGNPTVKAPDCVNETIRELTTTLSSSQLHGYTSAQGDVETRTAIVNYLNKTYCTKFTPDNLYITLGAAASLTMTFAALTTTEQDEFIAIAPYFPEYKVFASTAGAKVVTIPPKTDDFQIDFKVLEAAITENTKGIIVNSPNNPSGVIYSEQTIITLAELLKKKSKEYHKPIFIIADEPYREIVYDDAKVVYITKYYEDTIVCYSYSKSLSLPGERIGFVLVPNEVTECKRVYTAIVGAARSLGYVCAPSLFQKVIAKCVGQTGDISEYKKNRDILYEGLTEIGYECFKPSGAFYMFVKALETDANAFCERAKQKDLLFVSAEGFGCPGYVRISYCVDTEMIKRSMTAFKALKDEYCN